MCFFLFSWFGCKTSQTTVASTNADVIIRNVHLIDAATGLRPSQTVLLRGNRIVDVRAEMPTRTTPNTHVIDGTGRYLIPGLWDAHVHLVFEPDLTSSMFRLFLAHGVTSVRDTGGQLHLVKPERDRSQQDPTAAPRVKIAGPLLDGLPVVYDGKSPFNPHLGVGAGNISTANELVDSFLAANVDLLKAYEMLQPEVFRRILLRGQSADVPVTGHVPLSMDVVDAVDAGLTSMEHLRNLEFSCSSDWKDLLVQRQQLLATGRDSSGAVLRRNIHNAQRSHAVRYQDADRRNLVLRKLADEQVWQIPTMTIMLAFTERFFMRPDWQASFDYLPESTRRRWADNSARFAQSPVPESAKRYSAWFKEMIGHLKTANVPLLAGTDCPIFYLTPGYSLHEELALLVANGLTPLEALDAATHGPARYFKMDRELGLIEPGMLADLVMLDANPLEDITNTRRIHTVIRDGRVYDRAALDELLRADRN